MSGKTLRVNTGAKRANRAIGPMVGLCLVVGIAMFSSLSCNKRTGSGGSRPSSCTEGECKVTSEDGLFGTSFAAAVAVSGDLLAVGAPDDSEAALAAGAVYMFERDGVDWKLVDKLFAEDAAERDRFGAAVDLEGDALIVGAQAADVSGDNSGAAYVFRLTDGRWEQEEKIVPADGEEYDSFGASVAIHGNTAVVGAPLDDEATFAAGAVYVFSFDAIGETWLPADQKITSSNVGPGDLFGYAVATDGTSISVGAPFKAVDPPEFDPSPDPNNTPANNFAAVGLQRNAGNGYIYRWNGASFTNEVIVFARRDPRQCEIDDLDLLLSGETSVPDVFEGNLFGQATDVDGDLVVFGSPFADSRIDQGAGCRDRKDLNDAGAAYVYRWTGATWVYDERLIEAEPTAGTDLGFGVAILDAGEQRVVVGAPGYRPGSNDLDAGAAYVYLYDAGDDVWDREPRIIPSDGESYSRFGNSAAIQDGEFVIGAVGDRNSGTASGAAYVFEE